MSDNNSGAVSNYNGNERGDYQKFKKSERGKKEHFSNFGTASGPGRGELSTNSSFNSNYNLFQFQRERGAQSSLLNSEGSNFEGSEDSNISPSNRWRKRINNKSLDKSKTFNNSPIFIGFGHSRNENPWKNAENNSDELENLPWITKPNAFINLTTSKPYFEEELNQLVEFIKPTSKELLARAWVVGNVVRVLEKTFDQAKCLPFGSFTTQLFLPGSDVDLVLLSDDLKKKGDLKSNNSLRFALYKIRDALKRNGLLINCEVVPWARIPLIKFTEPRTNIKVDICLNSIIGIGSSKLTLLYSEKYPQLKWLTMVVKLFLDRLDLNEPATGGMGGYAIFLLGLSLIQVYNLGHLSLCDLLINFLEYYGTTFNHEVYGIDFKVPGHYFSKSTSRIRSEFKDEMVYNRQLIIIDPNQENNIASKAAVKFGEIKNQFRSCYSQLNEKLNETNSELNNQSRNDISDIRIYSILKNWIKFDKFDLNHRYHLKNVYLPDSHFYERWIIDNINSFTSTLNISDLASVNY